MTTTEQVKQYAACVFEPDDIVEVRAIASGGRVRTFWRLAHDLYLLVPEWEKLNRDGFNVYVGPNPRKAEGLSGDDSVLLCRTLFVDFDGVEPGDGCGRWEFIEPRIETTGLPMPTLTVFSGHGVHCYWRLTEPMPPTAWVLAQTRLIAALGTDPTIKNPERIMRVPGFANHKAPTADCFTIHAMEAN